METEQRYCDRREQRVLNMRGLQAADLLKTKLTHRRTDSGNSIDDYEPLFWRIGGCSVDD